jgi:hypothetical protein
MIYSLLLLLLVLMLLRLLILAWAMPLWALQHFSSPRFHTHIPFAKLLLLLTFSQGQRFSNLVGDTRGGSKGRTGVAKMLSSNL